MAVSWVSVGTTSDDWIWVLKDYGSKLYAGTYKLNLPRIYTYTPWTAVESFSGGESVYRMAEFNGVLYCNSEDLGFAGHTYKRISDTNWTSVHQVSNYFPRPLGVHGGYMYAAWADASVNARLYRTANGTSWSLVKSWANRHVISFATYNGQLYLLGGKYPSNDSWAAVTPSWNDVAVISDHPDYPWHFGVEFNGKLYLGQDGGMSVYSYDGSSKVKVLQVAAGVVYNHRCGVFDGQVYFTFGQAWKAASGESRIYRSATGNLNDWGAADLYGSPLATFANKPNARAIGEFGNKLYVGIHQNVYRMDETGLAPSAPTYCTAFFVALDKSYCTWIDNSSDETGFRIEYDINGGGWTFFENKGVNATQSSERQFTVEDNVTWRVRAYNVDGDSAWSTSSSVYIGSGGGVGVWTTQADFEDGTLASVWVPEGLNRLELKRLALSGTATYIFDGGACKKWRWLSLASTNPNKNIYYRDDFRDDNLEAWTIVGGTWAGYGYYMRGTGNADYKTNRVRVGPTTWAGQDILFKGYYTSAATPGHRFYLRSDAEGSDFDCYGFVISNADDTVYVFRLENEAVLDLTDKSVAATPGDAWYWFRIQIYTSGSDVVQRIKWWVVGGDEPGAWAVTHTWTGIWRATGCFGIGRHTTAGENRYDNILISRKEGIPSPANASVSFKFWPSKDGTNWGAEHSAIADVPDSRFIKIQATLARNDLLSAMPTLEDMTLNYRFAPQSQFL